MSGRPIATSAPLPTFCDLVGSGNSDDGTLVAPWIGQHDRAAILSRATWAMRAIVDGLTDADGTRPRFWVPDYFCNSALAAVRPSAALVFYPVTDRFEPDWQACEAMAVEEPPRLFLQVHYFGWPRDMNVGRAFCRAYGAVLIEDAAHVLAPSGDVGIAGDYTIWSLYKHLPAPDGGLLVSRVDAPAATAVFAAADRLAARGTARVWPWLFRRTAQVVAPRAAAHLRTTSYRPFDRDPQLPGSSETSGISRLARRMIGAAAGRLEFIADRRRANEAATRATLCRCTDLRPAFPLPPPGCAPYRAVFRADNSAQASFWYNRLAASGHAVETWPDLADEVLAAPHIHRAALALRATCFALPIHADRTPEELAAAYGEVCA